jgi:hypothetical protein
MRHTEATWWARRLVLLATHWLPVGDVRLHHRLELLSGLWGESRRRQAAYALGLVLHTRRLTHDVREAEGLIRHGVPLTCRLNLHHVWRLESTEDGHRYKACRRCHKDNPFVGLALDVRNISVP